MAGKLKKTTEEISADIKTEARTKKATEVGKTGIEKTPSGSTVLDLILGGGYPVGKIVNIVGDNSSGKTLLACEAIAAARKKYGDKLKWRYNDAEAGFSFDSKMLYGFDVIDETKPPSATIEEFEMDLHRELQHLEQGETLIYILDSLDSLSSLSEIEAAEDRRKAIETGKEIKGTYGMQKQKFLSEFFRLQATAIKDARCLLVIISQVRENIGVMYGPKFRRSGGKALDFFAAQIIWLSEIEKKEKKGRAVGITVKARTSKNKVGLPFRSGYIDVLFDLGIDDVSGNLCYLCNLRTDLGKMKKADAVCFKEFQGDLPRAIEYVERHNLETELASAVIDKWEKIEHEISALGAGRKPRF